MCLLGNVYTLIMRHMIDWGSERGENFCFHKQKVAKKLQKIQTYSKERPEFRAKSCQVGQRRTRPVSWLGISAHTSCKAVFVSFLALFEVSALPCRTIQLIGAAFCTVFTMVFLQRNGWSRNVV